LIRHAGTATPEIKSVPKTIPPITSAAWNAPSPNVPQAWEPVRRWPRFLPNIRGNLTT
jgi:hypothetical protein